MKKFIICSSSFIILLFYSSCKKDQPIITPDLGYNYFPSQVGRYIIYDVDSIVHDDFTLTVDTFKYQVKELIDSIYLDNSNRPTLQIKRYRKNYNNKVPYSSIPWTLKNLWFANRTNTSAEKVEENQRFIKLVFPVIKNRAWNGNAANTLDEWEYKFTDVDIARTLAGINFDSTAFVKQIDNETLIDKKYFVEIYAKNVGMIYKKIIDVKSFTITPLPIMKRISSGIEYKMTINSYGIN